MNYRKPRRLLAACPPARPGVDVPPGAPARRDLRPAQRQGVEAAASLRPNSVQGCRRENLPGRKLQNKATVGAIRLVSNDKGATVSPCIRGDLLGRLPPRPRSGRAGKGRRKSSIFGRQSPSLPVHCTPGRRRRSGGFTPSAAGSCRAIKEDRLGFVRRIADDRESSAPVWRWRTPVDRSDNRGRSCCHVGRGAVSPPRTVVSQPSEPTLQPPGK